jgi:hypothetical protein
MKLLKTIRLAAAVAGMAASLALVVPAVPVHAESMTDILARHDAQKAAEAAERQAAVDAHARSITDMLAQKDAAKTAAAAAQKAETDAAVAQMQAQPRPTGEPTLPGNPKVILDRPLDPPETPEQREARLQDILADHVAVESQVKRIHAGTLVRYWYDDKLTLHRIWDANDGRWHETGGSFDKAGSSFEQVA